MPSIIESVYQKFKGKPYRRTETSENNIAPVSNESEQEYYVIKKDNTKNLASTKDESVNDIAILDLRDKIQGYIYSLYLEKTEADRLSGLKTIAASLRSLAQKFEDGDIDVEDRERSLYDVVTPRAEKSLTEAKETFETIKHWKQSIFSFVTNLKNNLTEEHYYENKTKNTGNVYTDFTDAEDFNDFDTEYPASSWYR